MEKVERDELAALYAAMMKPHEAEDVEGVLEEHRARAEAGGLLAGKCLKALPSLLADSERCERLEGVVSRVRRLAEWEGQYVGQDARADRVELGLKLMAILAALEVPDGE